MRPLACFSFALLTLAAAGCPTNQLTTGPGKGGEVPEVAILPEQDQGERPTTLQAEPGQNWQASAAPGSSDTAELPAAFPRDVPLYTRGRLAASAEEGNGFFVELETSDSPAEVLSFYHGRLREFGWRVGDPYSQPLERNVVLATKDSRLLMMVCRQSANQTEVILSVSHSGG